MQAGDLLRLGFDYGTTNNNGNVLSQTIARPGFSATQTYTYDAYNRIQNVQEGADFRDFAYKEPGNLYVPSWSTGAGWAPGSFTPSSPSWFDGNNRLVNAVLGIQYDAAGNLTAIGGFTFAYDAENRLVSSTLNSVATTYAYDGEGRRVKKGSVVMVYDAFGRLAAEYGGTADPVGTEYLTADHLGSTRLVTSAAGAERRCLDYLPFGEQMTQGMGTRGACYASATEPRVKFTGKERDAETGLDYFGARYFSGAQGRFTSPDQPLVDQNPFEPQSWNLFSYVRNNPLIFTDPTGRCRKGADGKYHDSEDGPCVAPGSTSITVAEKAPKERDHAAEAQAEMLRMQLEAWRRDQQRSKPKDEQPLREAARQTLELAYQRTAHDLGCVALGYGIETAAVVPSMEIVPKRFAPAAAKGGTSIASTILRGGPRGLPIPTPVGTPGTATFAWRSSNTIGGVFGRWLPYVGLGVSVYRMSQCLGWQP
ncbi:MAG: RHS repeat domain-containing protein [Acidobacteriota bacterium]